MNPHSIRQILTGVALTCVLAIVAACSGMSSSSVNPTAPTAAATAGANFSPNPDPPCDPSTDTCPCDAFPDQPHCQPTGTPCSPGYWKNHEEHFDAVCTAAAALPGDFFTSCGQLETAVNCKGNAATCRRHEAAAALNTVSGCVED